MTEHHATEAKRTMRHVLDACETDENTGALVGIIAAQTHATLALVEQQRIANLIALAKGNSPAQDASEALSNSSIARGGEKFELRPEIAAALGVSDE